MLSSGPLYFRELARTNHIRASAALVALAACSSAANHSDVPPVGSQLASTTRLSPGDSTRALLYVIDSGTNEVSTFAWPKPKNPTGTLLGFSEPQGGCSDAKGNAYVSNTGDSDVLGFAGTKNIDTLNDAGQYPVGCAYDWKYGNMAVANIASTSGGSR
jgi:hypothetical protein